MTESSVTRTPGAAQDVFPPGLMGHVASFIYGNAPYPNLQVAIVGAIAFMAAVFGRACNVSGAGLNIWIAIVGETAIGKEAAADGISKLITACRPQCNCIGEFFGPSKWASAEAMHKRLAKTPSVLGFMGELGLKAKAWCSPKAAPMFTAIIAFMLDAYSKSGRGSILQGQENADEKNGAHAIYSPSLSLMGDATPSTFFAALDEQSIANGFLPRWIKVPVGDRRGERNKTPQSIPGPWLVNNISNAASFALTCQRNNVVVDVALDPDADILSDELERLATANINGSNVEITRHLWSRVHLNVLKLAALCAVGCMEGPNSSPVISADHFLWAQGIVVAGVEAVMARFASGDTGEEGGNEAKQLQKMRGVIRDYVRASPGKYESSGCTFDMHRDHVFTKKYLFNRLANLPAFKLDRGGASKAIARTLKLLQEAGEIGHVLQPIMGSKYGKASLGFSIHNEGEFMRNTD